MPVRQKRADPRAAGHGCGPPRAGGVFPGETTSWRDDGWLGAANGDAALALADLVGRGCDPELHGHLVGFAVRVGARRLADAAACLRVVGHADAAATLTGQVRLVGSLQYPLVTGDDGAAAAVLRDLAPTYGVLRDQLTGFRHREDASAATPPLCPPVVFPRAPSG